MAIIDAMALIGLRRVIRQHRRTSQERIPQGPSPQIIIRPYGAAGAALRFTIQNAGVGTAWALRLALDWDFSLNPMTLDGLDIVSPSSRKVLWDPGMHTNQLAVWVRLEFRNEQEQWYRYVIQCVRPSDDEGWKLVPDTEAQTPLGANEIRPARVR